ncbi:glycoside hydrolase, partial [Brachionus plicatilis]
SGDSIFGIIGRFSVLEKKQGLIIDKIQIFNLLKCLRNCEKHQQCQYASFNSSFCVLYSFYAKYYLQNGSKGFLYEKKNQKNFGLVNYWPIEDGQARDLVGSKDLYDSFNTVYSQDRHGSTNSALNFSGGKIRAPTGVYFGNEFTVLAWVKLKSYMQMQRLFDFGNDQVNNVIVILTCEQNYLCIEFFKGFNKDRMSTTILPDLNVWYHFGFSLKAGKVKIYLNGTLAVSFIKEVNPLYAIERTRNYFGGNDWAIPSAGDYHCDEMKFFNIELSDSEIRDEYFYEFH